MGGLRQIFGAHDRALLALSVLSTHLAGLHRQRRLRRLQGTGRGVSHLTCCRDRLVPPQSKAWWVWWGSVPVGTLVPTPQHLDPACHPDVPTIDGNVLKAVWKRTVPGPVIWLFLWP
jgi:hypothetical protein